MASQEQIASHAGISPKTVQRHLKLLCNHHYLKDLTPSRRNRPHVYADTGKARIIGLVEAKIDDTVGRTESPTGRTESPTYQDRESYPGRTESPMKKEETPQESFEERGGDASLSPACASSQSDLPDAKTQMAILFPSGGSGHIADYERSIEQADWEIRRDEVRQAAAHFLKASGLPIPNSVETRRKWIRALNQHVEDFGVSVLAEIYPPTVARLRKSKLTIGWPGSLTITLPAIAAELNGGTQGGIQQSQSPTTQSARIGPDAQRISEAIKARSRSDRRGT